MKGVISAGLRELIDSFEKAIVINKNGYEYFIHPLTDGVPYIDYSLLEISSELVIKILRKYDINTIDKIITVEALGIPLATAVAMKLKKAMAIARKRVYGLEEEVVVEYSTGYSSGILSVSNISKSERIVIIDDILSTGGTLLALSKSIEKLGGKIVCAVFLVEKEGLRKHLDFSFPIESILKVRIENGKVKVLDLHYCCYESGEGNYST